MRLPRLGLVVLLVWLIPGAVAPVHAANQIVGVAATPDGSGQWTTDSNGAVRNVGRAPFYGSLAGTALSRPVVGITATPPGKGYWLVASDGGIFTFGDARFFGSTGAIHLNQPIVGMAPTPTGNGYWLVARDGGIFTFGDAAFHGSGAGSSPGETFAGMARAASGYWLATTTGKLLAFGGATDIGRAGDHVVAVSVAADGLATAHEDGHVEVHRPPGAVPTVPLSTATRTAWQWPFASSSPWNTPVGGLARFESATDVATATLTRPDVPPWVNAGQYSHPVYKASAGDPLVTFHWPGHPDIVINAPLSIRPAAGTDAHLHVVDPSGRWVDEFFGVSGTPPVVSTRYHVRNDLLGDGVSGGGTRAYGGSAIGGLIRSWEVSSGSIQHALAVALEGEQLATGPVWPASSQDGNAATAYSGAVHMGALMALPPDVDVNALGLSHEGQMLAHAFQDYGGYVVDLGGCFCIYAEPSLDGTSALASMRHDLGVIRSRLRLVTDNGQLMTGGGGLPRRSPAPLAEAGS